MTVAPTMRATSLANAPAQTTLRETLLIWAVWVGSIAMLLIALIGFVATG
jgi:hypothetical protein